MLYTIYLNFKDKISEHTLPSGENLIYDIDISTETDTERCTVTFENIDGVWSVVSGRYTMTENGENRILSGGDKINMHVRSSSRKFVILVYEPGRNRVRFTKYLLADSVSIGSSKDCSIIIPGELISGKHAVISRNSDCFTVTDYSTNGIYINGEKAQKKTDLRIFDTIYIFGTKIIFLGDVLAVNNSDTVSSSLPVLSGYAQIRSKNHSQDHKSEFKIRTAVSIKNEVCILELKNEHTEDYRSAGFSDILRTAFLTSALMTCAVSLPLKNDILRSSAFFALFSAGSAAFLTAADHIKRSFHIRRMQEQIINETEAYIKVRRNELSDLAEKYRSELESENRTFRQLYDAPSGTLCCRAENSKGFAVVRTGSGTSDFSSHISLRSENDALRKLAESFRELRDVPVTADLKKHRLVMLTGNKNGSDGMARLILCGLAGENRPDALKIYVFLKSSDEAELGWVRWIPHVFSADRMQRFVSYDTKTQNGNLFSLTSELQRRTESGDQREDPRIIVFFSSESIYENEAVRKYIFSGELSDVSFIVSGSSEELRRNATLIYEGTGEKNEYAVTGYGQRTSLIKAEIPDAYECNSFAGKLLGNIDTDEMSGCVPEQVSLFGVLGIKETDNSDILRNYKINYASEGISAAIGIGERSEKFIIDLHEKKHGPHGLVAGMTGSGKSEVLQTLIASLALRYSPQELAFILVDYKGGGMSDAFDDLPHTAGTITNLTDSVTDSAGQSRRVLISLRSEIKKRQQLFRRYNINHIDMYSKLRACGNADEPLPHIVIIVDEFAELRREQPDFISQLISISRIGRSLGLHLILATQKPSGVVDDEIWSNSRFRICLRVQDRNDSMEMLRRTEAAELTTAGRAYIQIGNNEIFEMVQTGYSGEIYDPESEMSRRAYMIDIDGKESVIRIRTEDHEKISQLRKTVESIKSACASEKIENAQRLWNPPLPRNIRMPEPCEVQAENMLVCTAGTADDPENQRSFPVVFDLNSEFNLLVAGRSGSGKTNLVKVILASLLANNDNSVLKLYIFDFSGGEYRNFSTSPHCEKYYEDAESSDLRTFFCDMKNEIKRRKQIFADAGVSGYAQYRDVRSDIPALFIVFEGYYIFRELYPEKEEDFLSFTRDSARYGIFVVSTVRQLCDMKFRIRYNFRNIIAFTLDDSTEYQLAFGKKPGFEIAQVPGRGFFKADDILEFQTFLFDDKNIRFKVADSISSDEETDILSDQERLCCTVKNIYDERILNFLNELGRSGTEVLWWTGSDDPDIRITGNVYSGTDGAEAMLKKLRDIFSVRRDLRKFRGAEHFETVYAVIDRLDDFCRCVSSRNDLQKAASAFLKGGSGYGVCFVSETGQKDDMNETEIYRIFISYSTGENNVKSNCL